MPEIVPFRAVRYNPARIPDLSAVVCGPYDIISPAEREALSKRSPYNAVLIELAEKGKAPTGAGEASGLHSAASSSAYEAVAKTLKAWLAEGVLAKDDKPSFTVLEEKFQVEGKAYSRQSLWGAVKLSPFGQGLVHPHEKTFPGPKEDRYKVLSATRMNLSPVFGMVSDPSGAFAQGLAVVSGGKPLASAAYQGIELKVHRLEEKGAPASFWKAVREQAVVIADGHHRYETALKYRDEVGGGESSHVLMALVGAESKGLLVQPTHRVARFDNPRLYKDFMRELEASFEITPLEGTGPQDWEEEVSAMKGEACFGLIRKEAGAARGYRLRAKSWEACLKAQRAKKPGHQDGFYALDVAVVAHLLPESGVKETPDRDAPRAAQAVCADDQTLTFLVRAVSPENVFALAAAGERFPEKTTYFYPKMPTGIVFRAL